MNLLFNVCSKSAIIEKWHYTNLNCGGIEDGSGCNGWRGKRTNGCWTRLALI